jgi:tetratricopeptide (TPR) repeat protein
MAMLYGIFVWAAVRSWRTVFGRTGESGLVVLGAFWAASAGYLLHLLAGVSVTGSTFLLWVALGALLAPTARRVAVSPPRRGRFLSVAVLLLLALGVASQFLPLAADHAYVQAQTTPTGTARTEAAREAARLNPLSSEYRAAVGLAYAAEVRAAFSAGKEAHEAGEDTTPYATAMREKAALAETALRDAIAFSPDEVDLYTMLADLFNFAGETLDEGLFGDAIRVAREGIARAPHDPLIRVQLARALLKTGRTAVALRELEYTLDMDPADGEAALLLAATYERLGRLEDAVAILEAAESRMPGQTGIAEAIERLEAGP